MTYDLANSYVYYDADNASEGDGFEVTVLQDETANNRDADKTSPVTTGPDISVSGGNKRLDCTAGNSLNMGFDGSGFATSSFEVWLSLALDDGHSAVGAQALFGANGAGNDWFGAYITPDGKLVVLIGNTTDGLFWAKDSSETFSNGANSNKVIRMRFDLSGLQITIEVDGVELTLDGELDGDLTGLTPANYDLSVNWLIGNRNQNGSLTETVADSKLINKFAIIPQLLNSAQAANVLSQFTI